MDRVFLKNVTPEQQKIIFKKIIDKHLDSFDERDLLFQVNEAIKHLGFEKALELLDQVTYGDELGKLLADQNINESTNPLKDAAEYAKKHQKGKGYFVKLDAGNVEEGNKFFNRATSVNTTSEGSCEGEGMAESLKEEFTITGYEYKEGSKGPRGRKYISFRKTVSDEDQAIEIANDIAKRISDVNGLNHVQVLDPEGNLIYETSGKYDAGADPNVSEALQRGDKDKADELKKEIQWYEEKEDDQPYNKGEYDAEISNLTKELNEDEQIFEPRTINIVDELNTIDSEDYQDLVNMYNAIILTPSEKESLIVCIKNNDKQGIIDFINKAYSEQVLDEPFEMETEVIAEPVEDKKYVIKASDDGIDIIRVDGADTIEEAGEKALDATSLHSYVAVFDTETGEKVFGSDKIGE